MRHALESCEIGSDKNRWWSIVDSVFSAGLLCETGFVDGILVLPMLHFASCQILFTFVVFYHLWLCSSVITCSPKLFLLMFNFRLISMDILLHSTALYIYIYIFIHYPYGWTCLAVVIYQLGCRSWNLKPKIQLSKIVWKSEGVIALLSPGFVEWN